MIVAGILTPLEDLLTWVLTNLDETVGLTWAWSIVALVVIVRLVVGDAADHTFASVLTVGLKPAAVLLPVAGILLVTSEWSQRTGMITFALVPMRSRIIGAKLIASLVLAVAMLAVSVGIVAAGVLIASGTDGAWADAATLIAQSALDLTAGMLVGVAFGMVVASLRRGG